MKDLQELTKQLKRIADLAEEYYKCQLNPLFTFENHTLKRTDIECKHEWETIGLTKPFLKCKKCHSTKDI